MDTGTLGERREIGFDALYAEAKEALSQDANRLRALTERLREMYAQALSDWERERASAVAPRDHAAPKAPARPEPARSMDPTAAELARGKAMLTRLELAVQELEAGWLFLERGQEGPARETVPLEGGPRDPGQLIDRATLPMYILEAQEGERARLAAELHDGPAQALSNAVFQTEVVDRTLQRDPEAAPRELQALRALLERELDDLRGFINQLRPVLAQQSGLDAALEECAAELTETGVPVEVRLEAPGELLDEARRAVVLRVAQEALRNVRKHAEAQRAWLTSSLQENHGGDPADPAWVLEVGDDGRGFDPEQLKRHASRRNFGLRFMRERAELIGAGFDVETSPSAGTLVRLTITRP